eukprot:12407451-Karenia_brevis.AAC.1
MPMYRGKLEEIEANRLDEFDRARYITKRKAHRQNLLVQGNKLDQPIGVDVQLLSILAPDSPGSPLASVVIPDFHVTKEQEQIMQEYGRQPILDKRILEGWKSISHRDLVPYLFLLGDKRTDPI